LIPVSVSLHSPGLCVGHGPSGPTQFSFRLLHCPFRGAHFSGRAFDRVRLHEDSKPSPDLKRAAYLLLGEPALDRGERSAEDAGDRRGRPSLEA